MTDAQPLMMMPMTIIINEVLTCTQNNGFDVRKKNVAKLKEKEINKFIITALRII